MSRALWIAGAAAWSVLTGAASHAASAIIDVAPSTAPQVLFAIEEIEAALKSHGHVTRRRDPTRADRPPFTSGTLIRFGQANEPGGPEFPGMKPEGFAVSNTVEGGHNLITIYSLDAAGAMYGGFEVAEQIAIHDRAGVVDTRRDPHMAMRGTKFNIPLDLRNPSYSDMGDSAQQNIATVWDFDFWREYLDQLSRQRYNFVSLWNLHPFPSMVRVPEYPDVALADVWRTRAALAEDYSTRTTDLLSPEMLANKEVIRKLSIEQKIEFWRRVMAYARDRNIQFHVVTWNIFTYGVDGKYGITDAMDNPRTVDYFRASVREMFRTYPLLAGIGLTTGENMGEVRMYSGGVDSFDAKENWVFATYGQGVLDAARAEPERRFRLIHRQHETRAQDIAATFKPLIDQPNVDFVFSFKYAQAHILSSTTQRFHRGFVESLGNLKTLWTLRNDDALMFRWAAPDFVREFVDNIPREPSQGYYLGSDMWVWGREFLSKDAASPRQLEIGKHWLHFLLWGRLGFDPSLDNARIGELVALRFPGVDGARLLAAWQNASMIYPLVTGFHWADFDFQWYIEGCRSRPAPAKTASGFHSVETFIDQPVHPGSGNLTIPQFIAGAKEGRSPLEVARLIDRHADWALVALERLPMPRSAKPNRELDETLADIRAMALLGKYYAAKIRGATALATFRATRLRNHQDTALYELERAEKHWLEYTSRTAARYRNPLWTNRVGLVDWTELNAEVAADRELAKKPLP